MKEHKTISLPQNKDKKRRKKNKSSNHKLSMPTCSIWRAGLENTVSCRSNMNRKIMFNDSKDNKAQSKYPFQRAGAGAGAGGGQWGGQGAS